MTTTQLTKPDQELQKQWQERQGVKTRPKINTIKLVNSKLDEAGDPNPDYGKLFAYSYDGEQVDMEEIDIKKAEFFLAKVRTQIKCKTMEEERPKYWCREIDKPEDWLEIMDSNGEMVADGLYRNLKEEYDLKYTDSAYVLYKGKVYRWNITGAHFESWFKVKNVALRDPHTFTVDGMAEQKSGSVFYYALNFKLGKPYPLTDAIKVLDNIDKGLANVYKAIKEEETPSITADEAVKEDLPF